MRRGDRYETRVARVCSRLNAEKARYLVVGATAMQLWGTTRATRDIDILIEPTVRNARRVLRALASLGLGMASEHLAEDVAARPVTMIGDAPNVDILTRAWNLKWEQASKTATSFDIEGVSVPVASIEDLIESKRTGRLQDAADIEVLQQILRLREELDE
jgi:predicted nucleotidyltransferase